MKRTLSLIIVLMVASLLYSCILSKTPKTTLVTALSGSPMTFSVTIFPLGANFAWTLDGTPQVNTKNSFIYTPSHGEHVLSVTAKHILGTDTQTWNILDAEAVEPVGSSGGTIAVTNPSSPLIGAQADIPAGALPTTVTLTISEAQTPAGLPGQLAGPCVDFGPDGTQFSTPVGLSLPYADADNDGKVDGTGVSEDQVKAYFFNENANAWEEVPIIGRDFDANLVRVQATHFSLYNTVVNNKNNNWGTSMLIGPGNCAWHQLAIDSYGNAIVIWLQWDGTHYYIWANRYTPLNGWGTAEPIETDPVGRPDSIFIYSQDYGPQIAMDPEGNAIVVWWQWDGIWMNIWANRYTPSEGWETPELIETDDIGNAKYPDVAMDPNGNAIAVWILPGHIAANRYTPTGGWGTAEMIDTYGTDNSSLGPRVVADSESNAIAVWPSGGNIWANRYTPAGGWGTARLIGPDNGNSDVPQISIGQNGNAVVVWERGPTGNPTEIWANLYTPASGWSTAELIDTDNIDEIKTLPQVAIDPYGNAIAVWYKFQFPYDSEINLKIWANRYTSASGWDTPEIIETNNDEIQGMPHVAIDSNGNAIAVWMQQPLADVVQSNIWANRYTPADGWETPELIETDDTEYAAFPQIAMSPDGNAIAVWGQQPVDGTMGNIWANCFK
jgi:hypothetical protein